MVKRWKEITISIFAVFASIAVGSTAGELISKGEQLWLQNKYNESNNVLNEALKAKLTNAEKAEIYWRMARNFCDLAGEMPREAKEERLKNYLKIQELAKKCMDANPNLGECYLWLGLGIVKEGTQKGVLNMLGKIAQVEELWLKCIQLKPTYRAVDGTANTVGDAYCALGVFYRLAPDWDAVKMLYKTKGDKQKSVEMLRKAVELEPNRVGYAKELGISLICLGQFTRNPQTIEEGMKWMRKVLQMPNQKPADDIDKQHAKMILDNPSLACEYSRDAL